MDPKSLVREDVEAGEELVKALGVAGFQIVQAAWVYEAEDDQWRLVLGLRPDQSRASAYDAALSVLADTGALDPNRVTIFPADVLEKSSLWVRSGAGRLSGGHRGPFSYSYNTSGINYENEFSRMVAQIVGENPTILLSPERGEDKVDAILQSDDKTYLVELKATPRPLGRQEISVILNRLNRARRELDKPQAELLIISRSGFTQDALNEYGSRPTFHLVQWRPEVDPPGVLSEVLGVHAPE